MMGMHGEAWVNTAIQEADLLIALGMRFDDRVTGNVRTYARQRTEDSHRCRRGGDRQDRAGRRRHRRRSAATCSARSCPASSQAGSEDWIARIDALKGDSAVRDIQNLPDDGHLYAAHVMNDLWRATNGRAVVVTDVGQHQMWEAQYYHHESPRTLITSGGLGTMGFALPAAIGAKVSRPDAEVWTIAGDGGFQMTMPELATIKQEGLDVKIAVINNGYLGMVRQWQEFFYERRYAATPLLSPDFAKIAEAYGLRAIDGQDARRSRAGDRSRASASGHGAHRLPGRAGRHRLSDGASRRGPARDDSPALGVGRDGSRRIDLKR